MGLDEILRRPSRFFEGFAARPSSRSLALFAFLLLTIAFGSGTWSRAGSNRMGFVLSGLAFGWVSNIFLLCFLWFWVGARVFGGGASFDMTLRGVGYALFWPSLVALLASPMFWSAANDENVVNTLLLLGLLGAATVWAMGLAAIAVHHIHGLTWPRTLAVLLWYPLVYGGLIVATLLMGVE